MTKSAAGTTEQPGKNIPAKCRLNKEILDQIWFELGRLLDYNLTWPGS